MLSCLLGIFGAHSDKLNIDAKMALEVRLMLFQNVDAATTNGSCTNESNLNSHRWHLSYIAVLLVNVTRH